MRPDMAHLLVERGHVGTGYTRYQPKGWAGRCRFLHGEDEPLEAWLPPVRRPQFSENLNPLRRFLVKQVGRSWDTVYAEIRARVDADNAVQFHILQHLYDDLAVNVWEQDGELWCHQRGGPLPLIRGARWRRQPALYVCPRTGLIKRIKRIRHRAPQRIPAPAEHLSGSRPGHDYRLIAGQWYEVWWMRDPQCGNPVIDRKRQLGWKELRDLRLRD